MLPPRRIGFLGQSWSPATGGIEVHTEALARALVEAGMEVGALAWADEKSSTRIVRHGGVTITRQPRLMSGPDALDGGLASDAALELWLDTMQPDLVHVHHLSGWGARALDILESRGLPVVVTLHDDWLICPRGQRWHVSNKLCSAPDPETCAKCLGESHGTPEWAIQPLVQRLLHANQALQRVDRIMAPSSTLLEAHQRAGLECAGVHALGRIMPLGIDAQQLAAETDRLRGQRPDDGLVRLGVLGSVQPSKGVLPLAKAVVAAGRDDLVLEIHGPRQAYHGDSSAVDGVEALARDHDCIRLHPRFSPERRAEVIAMLDGVVVPSLWEEGFGLGAREARACGLPVMASRIGGLEQLDSDPGVTLVEPGDHGAWVAAIQKVQKGLIQPQTAIKSTLEMTEEVAEVYAAVLRERTKRAA